jgi:hypothetical protein
MIKCNSENLEYYSGMQQIVVTIVSVCLKTYKLHLIVCQHHFEHNI